VDLRRRDLGQLVLRALRREPQALERVGLGGDVHAARGADVAQEVLDHGAIDVIAPEERVAGGGEHLEDAGHHVDHGDVERAAAQIADEVLAIRAAVRAVAERRGRRLAEQAQGREPGDLRRVLRGLALRGVVPRRDRDDRARDRLAEVRLRQPAQLAQDQRAHLLRRDQATARQRDPGVAVRRLGELVRQHAREPPDLGVIVAAAEQPLRAEDRGFRTAVEALARALAHDRPGRAEPDQRRQHRRPLLGRQDARRAVAIDHGRHRVARAEVDAHGAAARRHRKNLRSSSCEVCACFFM
jgi:hypothetical protein